MFKYAMKPEAFLPEVNCVRDGILILLTDDSFIAISACSGDCTTLISGHGFPISVL